MSSLNDKVAIVTGGASGIGQAIARAFLSAGAQVVIADINLERLDTTGKELGTLGRVTTIEADVSKGDQVAKVFAQTISDLGQVDILVNCAGIADQFEPVGVLSEEKWNHVLAINLTSAYLCSASAVNHFLARSTISGTILNVGSQAGSQGFRAGAAYTVSKHGLVGLTKSMAAFYGRKNIRCNIIMPGPAETNIRDCFKQGWNEEGHSLALRLTDMTYKVLSHDLHQFGDLAVFLCSDGGKLINGAVISADGGATVG